MSEQIIESPVRVIGRARPDMFELANWALHMWPLLCSGLIWVCVSKVGRGLNMPQPDLTHINEEALALSIGPISNPEQNHPMISNLGSENPARTLTQTRTR